MSEFDNLVTQICSDYSGYMKYARLLRLVEKFARFSNWHKSKEAKQFIYKTVYLIYDMSVKEGVYG